MPGFENTYQNQVYHPDFLATISQMRTLRFMDWERTNGQSIENWSSRTTANSFSQAGPAGVSVEHMVDLANATNIDPWFTIPHLANDSYIQEFAILVKQRLKPHLRVYVEFSNELWNGGFTQAGWIKQWAAQNGLTNTEAIAYHGMPASQGFLERYLPVKRAGLSASCLGGPRFHPSIRLSLMHLRSPR